MDVCSTGPGAFWLALPTTIGAISALIAAWRSGKKADAAQTAVAAHANSIDAEMVQMARRQEARDELIADLEARVSNGNGGH